MDGEFCDIVQEAEIKTIPKKNAKRQNDCHKAKEAL